ncbi:hypothetical protein ACXC9Q_03340 [Kribbella sp. CWNU-51]
MSTDIERLLAAAADDSDQPLHTDVGDILVRARRSVRKGRIAAASTAILTTAAILGGIAAWSATRSESAGPAGTPKNQTITIDAKTGRIVDNETGKTVVPAPPVSPLSDAEVLRRCTQKDTSYERFLQHRGKTLDKTGRVDARWKIVVKSGDQSVLNALFLAPDKSVVSTCIMNGPEKPASLGRTMTADVSSRSRTQQPLNVHAGLLFPVTGVTRVLVDLAGESSPREALVGTDGFVTLGHPGTNDKLITLTRIRAYDAGGTRVYDQIVKPITPPAQPTVDPKVTVKTAEPITPQVVLTKDPRSGKALAPAPPVSPLSDDQIRDRCRLWEQEIATNPAYGGQGPQDPREKAAGPITSSWDVALKTGTGDKFTAVLISADQRVAVWCHMTKPTTKGGESDYTRHAVDADGKVADNLGFAMVPAGVAQMIIDLPAGPTRVLMANGFYTWGPTGGNSDIKTVQVGGYDAQGKQVYDTKKPVDAG